MALIEKFTSSVCTKCKACGTTPDPGFCATYYASDKEKFWKLLTHILVRTHINPLFLKELFTFVGFCGVFCNSSASCPQYSKKECDQLSTRVDCYDEFVGQSNAEILPNSKVKIYKSFSGIELDTIGKFEYGLQVDEPLLLATPKKKRKKIKKIVRRAMADMESKSKNKKKNKKKPKKTISTTFFCNDDEKWKAQIDIYLTG